MAHEINYHETVDRLPADTRYAVFQNESMSYDDGYGHGGRPSMSTRHYLSVITFSDEEALKDWILRQSQNTYSKSYKIFEINPVVVSQHVTIGIAKKS